MVSSLGLDDDLKESKLDLNVVMENEQAFTRNQKTKIMLARTLCHEAEIYVLNNPYMDLNRNSMKKLDVILRSLEAAGKLIILCPTWIQTPECSDKIVLIENNEVIEYGPYIKLQ